MPPEGVETVQGRLETFQIAHIVKRRGSTAKKRVPATLKWPSKLPTPEDLSQAGFYFHPSSSSPDNVKCFSCEVNLDGWEPEDDPIIEHYTHRTDCAWAVCQYVKRKFEQQDMIEEDPMSETYANARKATFEGWPHESKRGWKCKIEKMAEAGWHFDPSPGAEDGVTCAYCSVELSGWERKDDPFEEHLKRESNCLFFQLCDQFAASRPTKPKRARTSKASRASTQSTVSAINDDISIADLELNDDVEAAADDTVLTTATSSSKAPKGRKKTAPKVTKSKSKKVATDDSVVETVEASELGLSTSQPARKTKSKKPVVLDDSAIEISDLGLSTSQPARKPRSKKTATIDDSAMEADDLAVSTSKPVRQTRRKASRQVSAQVEVYASSSESQSKPSRAKGKKAIIEEPAEPLEEEPSKPKRSKKRTSDGSEKDVSIVSNATVITSQNPAKQARSTKRTSEGTTKGQTPKARLSALDRLESSVAVLDEPPSIFEDSPEKPAKRAKKQSSTRQPLQELEPSVIHRDSDMLRSSNMHEALAGTPEPSSDGGSPEPLTPTPARQSLSLNKRVSQQPRPTLTPGPSKTQKPSDRVATPSESPQSSDAENKPPSSRPHIKGLQLQPISPVRIALAPQSTPKTSPSKRANIMSRVQTEFRWAPADLEAVFLPHSPSKRSQSSDKENFIPGDMDMDMNNLSAKEFKETIKSVRESITDKERKMTVADWMKYTGELAGEKLMAECETMVTMFEHEGKQATRALEGIKVSR